MPQEFNTITMNRSAFFLHCSTAALNI